jgi:hypothetical protein
MFVLPTRVPAALLLLGLILARAGAQTAPQLLASTEIATVRSVIMVPDRDGPAVEILATQPLAPSISKLQNPLRLVIDLPNARFSGTLKRIDFPSDQVNGVRISQYQSAPPVARIVLDLATAVNFTWDAAGNRLMVRLQAQPASAGLPSAPAFTQGVQPAAVPLSNGANGAVLLAGSKVMPGSSVTAGSDTAILRLGRGGEVRVCPGTTVSVTASQNGRALMLGMSTGAMEAHYSLEASADSVLTPDFRIQLPGPGEFHYAISADLRGNTCVRALPGNTASVVVSELLGDGTYQVKPNEQVVFHSGRLSSVDAVVPAGCGCPPPAIPVMRAAATPPASESGTSASLNLSANDPPVKPASFAAEASPARLAMASETAALPPSKPNDIHVQVEAPFVFRADDPPPAPIQQAALLPARSRPLLPQTATLSAEQIQPPHRKFFGRIRSFFAALFG